MNEPTATLFRAEVMRRSKDQLHGTINLALPIGWQVMGYLLLATLVIAGAFLASASYGRVVTVSGAVTLDAGVATIVPSRNGIVAEVLVRDGQHVRTGAPLLRVRSEENLMSGTTAAAEIGRSVADQDAQLARQTSLTLEAARAEQARLQEEMSGLVAEIASLDSQIADQRRLIDAAATELTDAQRVALKGFISRRDLNAREATLLGRRQRLAELAQARAAKSASVGMAQRSVAQSQASAEAQIATARASQAALAARLTEVDVARGYTITAPVDGVVTAMTARVGQPTAQGQQFMLIVPSGSHPRVELYLPTTAIGFASPGQDVRLAVDAFPYQQFGTVPARIDTIASATIDRPSQNGSVPVYLVSAEMLSKGLVAFGRTQPLQPGMTLTARIVTEKRSLLRWLFEPIYAVSKR